jgi:MarR family transcriptional regulator, lower aerobic nicotinate degradation pathway regulator
VNLPTHPALTPYTGFLMRKVSQASFEAFAAIVARHGLHPMHFGLLTLLDAEGPISQHELGRKVGVDPSTMVARMDVLEREGLIARKRSDRDRRAYEIELTEKGRRKLVILRKDAMVHGELLFGVLSEEEREQLHRLLVKLAEGIDERARGGVASE